MRLFQLLDGGEISCGVEIASADSKTGSNEVHCFKVLIMHFSSPKGMHRPRVDGRLTNVIDVNLVPQADAIT